MLQNTAKRLCGIEHAPALVICNEEHRFSVAEQFRASKIPNSGIILEPVGRNTAPAIALAALTAIKNNNDPLLLVLAADHLIKNDQAFRQSVEAATEFAKSGKLVTFGIVPTVPETGYGYIKRGEAYANSAGYCVTEFVEKPNQTTAQAYLDSENYYWNSGMFLFKASLYLEELEAHSPEIYTACVQAISNTTQDFDFLRVDKAAFEACPDNSIDYAVMEPLCSSEDSDKVVVVPMDCGWSDIGSWSALWEVKDKDSNGNAFLGDVMSIDTSNSYIHATDKLVVTIGLEDVIIVETKDAILVSKQTEVQQVKTIVEQLKANERSEWQHHHEVYRPWGKYDSIDCGERFQVKHITVNPGAKLSVQMHHHRAEHWIVVSGTARVTIGGQESLLTENQSTYIPIGTIHALENPGETPLEIIEVQSGSYLGEDDIVRLEDRYGRKDKQVKTTG